MERNQTIPILTYLKMIEGQDFTIDGISLRCLEVTESPKGVAEHVDNYFLGISALGVMLLTYQIITYVLYIYNWYSSTDHNIKIRILPLQIYMRDIDAIIQKMQSSSDSSTKFNTAGLRRTAHLRTLKEQYYNFIGADKYCWIKYSNPVYKIQLKNHKPLYQKPCFCCKKRPTPRFLYELCELDESWAQENGFVKYLNGKFSQQKVARYDEEENKIEFSPNVKKNWQKVSLLTKNLASEYVQIKRQVYKEPSFYYTITYCCTLGYCCGTPSLREAPPKKVLLTDVFLGRYKPYISDPDMKPVDLDEDLYMTDGNGERVHDAAGNLKRTKHRQVGGIDDSLSRFFCGWWLGWTLQDMELALKSELDEEHLRTDLNIQF